MSFCIVSTENSVGIWELVKERRKRRREGGKREEKKCEKSVWIEQFFTLRGINFLIWKMMVWLLPISESIIL